MDERTAIDRRFAVLDHVPVGACVLRPDLTVLFWNHHFEAWTGIPRADILDRSVTQFVPVLAEARYYDRLKNIFAGGPPVLFSSLLHQQVVPGLLPDGQPRIQNTTVSPVPAPDGSGFWALLVAEDASDLTRRVQEYRQMRDRAQEEIKERKRAERALARSERLFRSLFESATIFIHVLDTGGIIRQTNPAAVQGTGYQISELIGHRLTDILSPTTAREFEVQFPELLKTGDSRLELEVVCKDRHVVTVDCTSSVIRDDQHQATSIVVFQRDISMQKRAELELRQASEMAHLASSAKSEFLANMSHEIRTPMNAIIAMTDLVMQMDLEPIQREHLGVVLSASEALLRLINDILDFSKIEAGKLELEPIQFNVRQPFRDTLSVLSMKAKEKGLEIRERIADDVPEELIGDPGRLRQIVTNLVGNAIKFTQKGYVEVAVTNEAISGSRALLRVTVKDTGIGIEEEKRRKIFDAFSQADGSTTRKFGGTGLGLTISRKLVEMMGGTIEVKSQVGRGAAFSFVVQLKIPSTSTQAHVAGDLVAVPVLITDPNPDRREPIVRWLRDWGMEPQEAADGDEVLAAMAAANETGDPIRVVVVAHHPPEIDGFDLSIRVRKRRDLGDTILVLVPAIGTPGEARRADEIGIAAYLTRPLEEPTLVRAIEQALGPTPVKRLITRHSLRAGHGRDSILLFAAHPTRLTPVRTLLDGFGFAVTTVTDAGAARKASEERRYDLILIAPGFDDVDYRASVGAVCGHLAETQRPPIVVLGEEAPSGARGRALDAGADDWLPVSSRSRELIAIVDQWISRESGRRAA